jgi:hypothetical protein
MVKENYFQNSSGRIKDDSGKSFSDVISSLSTLQTALEALLNDIKTNTSDLDSNSDDIESLLGTSNTSLSAIETTLSSIDTVLSDIENDVDGLETLITASNVALSSIEGNTDDLETLIAATNVLIAATNALLGNIDFDDFSTLFAGYQSASTTALKTISAIIGNRVGVTSRYDPVSVIDPSNDTDALGNSNHYKLSTAAHLRGFNGTTYDRLKVDNYKNLRVNSIDYDHIKLHNEELWSLGNINTAVTSGSSISIVIDSSVETHFRPSIESEVEARVYLYEVSAYSGHSSLTPRNKNLAGGSATGTFSKDPTAYTITDTIIDGRFIGSGRTGGSAQYQDEWILEASKIYILRLKNNSVSTGWMQILTSFYQ